MFTVPDVFQSSKGDGSISRTIKGAATAVVFIGTMYTPYTENEWVQFINLLLVIGAGIYSAYGFLLKLYNKYHGTNV